MPLNFDFGMLKKSDPGGITLLIEYYRQRFGFLVVYLNPCLFIFPIPQ